MFAISLPLILLAIVLYALRLAPRIAKPGRSSPWKTTRHGLTLKASTTALNSVAREWVVYAGPQFRVLATGFYNVGSVAGVAGSAVASLGALWALVTAWRAVWIEAEAHASVQSAGEALGKRAVEAVSAAQLHASYIGLEPLIPGITAPLWHLPTLLLALIIAQLVHEIGHALSAALDDVSPVKFAVSLHMLVLPSAAVSFPAAVDYLPTRARARVATAGAWHNLLMWAGLLALGAVGTLWSPPAVPGLTVDLVALGNGLEQQLRRGDVITHVDDVAVTTEDMWRRVINHEEDPASAAGMGWCVRKGDFIDASLGPCTESHLVGFTPVLFEAVHCLQPHEILKDPAGPCECDTTHMCIKLAASSHIVRIRYRSENGEAKQLLWNGERTVLYSISFQALQRPLQPLAEWGTLFASYLTMVSLSLYLFNLLLLPRTDGVHLLSTILSSGSPLPAVPLSPFDALSDDDDASTTTNGSGGSGGSGALRPWSTPRLEEAWARRLRRTAEGMTGATVAGWAVAVGIVVLLKSS